jgi:hypothetical protein
MGTPDCGGLEKLGMSEYTQRFAENRVDFSILPYLTDQDVEKVGVFLGDRRKILRDIANFEGTERSAPAIAADWRGTDRNVTAALMTVRDQW